jgi:flagellar hook-length control protein FliK
MLARVKLISRVSKAFQHLGREGGLVRLRLAPAELGTVQVEMQVRQGHVRARVVTETEAATAALREHLPDLRARLESLGMQVERLDVETESSEQGAHFNGNDSGGWQSPSDRRGSSSGFTPRSEVLNGVESDPPATTSNSQTDTPGIDLRV